jgi:hypothetical protein
MALGMALKISALEDAGMVARPMCVRLLETCCAMGELGRHLPWPGDCLVGLMGEDGGD